MSLIFTPITEVRETSLEASDISVFKSCCLFANYYKEYYQDDIVDLTFFIRDSKAEVKGYVLCSALKQSLTLPDGGIIISVKDDIPEKEKKNIYAQVFNHLVFLAKSNACKSIIVKDDLSTGSLSSLGEMLFNQRFKSRMTFEMRVDYLNFSQDRFHSSIRKSYKSLVNWGKKELQVTYINRDNPDFDSVKKFQDFHYKISGFKTRSDESWAIQYQMIKEGFGELALANYNNQLVAGSLFADYGDTSIYFTGVYERDLFEFGVSHFLLYDGISRSLARSKTSKFSLGYFDNDIQDSKWYNIQFFKKGFSTDLKPIIFWSKDI